ncbi:MAG: TlyA family RNA methyltransferase [Mesorhizobium sp.]|nr:TlyA family RNA methyltransferase [Mesorhizobium sp.]
MPSVLRSDTRLRLDELLVERGLFASRSRARDAVLRGAVRVAGQPETKPGKPVDATAEIAVDDPAQAYVSRAALKLAAGLDHFGIDIGGAVALDIGASTGGFTQILLERGAAHVIALDVGHGQLHASIASDPRVAALEGVNARDITLATLGGSLPNLVVADVSFISLRLALPAALDLAAPGARGVFLVKPQFEAGREAIGKGGILRDASLGPVIAQGLADWLGAQPGWRALGWIASPIEGGDGNREFLLAGTKDR